MASFLQSPEWQEIQERMGRKTERVSGALVIRHDLSGGLCYFYAPRPERAGREFLDAAEAALRQNRAIFLKIDPDAAGGEVAVGIRAHALQPQRTLAVNCRTSDAGLLVAMHPKTRYNVRLAERHGVSVRPLSSEEALARFSDVFPLLRETAERERFSLHPEAHYRILLAVGSGEFSNELWVAELGRDILAAAVVNWYRPSGTASYLHGASSRDRREVMAPHRLHWEIIRAGRDRGFDTYDFGGIDEARWPGVTRFKRGFGGTVIRYPASRDVVYRRFLYVLYRFSRRARHRPVAG